LTRTWIFNSKFKQVHLRTSSLSELTAPGTTQQNGIVEGAFATLLGRAKAMLNQAGFIGSMRHKLWAECARTSTLLENSMPDKIMSLHQSLNLGEINIIGFKIYELLEKLGSLRRSRAPQNSKIKVLSQCLWVIVTTTPEVHSGF
jgi:hypothetical protein